MEKKSIVDLFSSRSSNAHDHSDSNPASMPNNDVQPNGEVEQVDPSVMKMLPADIQRQVAAGKVKKVDLSELSWGRPPVIE